MPQKNLQKKSNSSCFKILIILFTFSYININCEHCDDEDYAREQEEKISATPIQDTLIFRQ